MSYFFPPPRQTRRYQSPDNCYSEADYQPGRSPDSQNAPFICKRGIFLFQGNSCSFASCCFRKCINLLVV